MPSPLTTIYLDIDGTILMKDGTPAIGSLELIRYSLENFEVYWLTTHCKGDAFHTVKYIKKYFPEEFHVHLEKILPTNWGAMKTDALDFSKNFFWLDDYVMGAEQKVLEENNAEDKHIMINLESNPYQLEEILEYLMESKQAN